MVLALSALNPAHWIIPLLMAELTPEETYKIIRLCSSLVFAPGTMRGEDGVEAELLEAVGEEGAAVVLALGDRQTLDFPPYADLFHMIQTARCFTFSKSMGEAQAAERLGLAKRIVHGRRAFVYRKLNGG